MGQQVQRHDGGRVRAAFGTYLSGACESRAASNSTLLVVDDEPLIRAYLVAALGDLGYQIIQAGSAERALDIMLRERPPVSLLLSDVGLPGASGAELVKRVRAAHPTLPTLLMSASDKETLVRARVLEPQTELLQKPFSIADLQTKLQMLLSASPAS